jgi:hypothetical protein
MSIRNPLGALCDTEAPELSQASCGIDRRRSRWPSAIGRILVTLATGSASSAAGHGVAQINHGGGRGDRLRPGLWEWSQGSRGRLWPMLARPRRWCPWRASRGTISGGVRHADPGLPTRRSNRLTQHHGHTPIFPPPRRPSEAAQDPDQRAGHARQAESRPLRPSSGAEHGLEGERHHRSLRLHPRVAPASPPAGWRC